MAFFVPPLFAVHQCLVRVLEFNFVGLFVVLFVGFVPIPVEGKSAREGKDFLHPINDDGLLVIHANRLFFFEETFIVLASGVHQVLLILFPRIQLPDDSAAGIDDQIQSLSGQVGLVGESLKDINVDFIERSEALPLEELGGRTNIDHAIVYETKVDVFVDEIQDHLSVVYGVLQ